MPLGYRPATHRVNLAGYPIGFFCEKCVKEMRKVWTEADTPYREWLAACEAARVCEDADLAVAA